MDIITVIIVAMGTVMIVDITDLVMVDPGGVAGARMDLMGVPPGVGCKDITVPVQDMGGVVQLLDQGQGLLLVGRSVPVRATERARAMAAGQDMEEMGQEAATVELGQGRLGQDTGRTQPGDQAREATQEIQGA